MLNRVICHPWKEVTTISNTISPVLILAFNRAELFEVLLLTVVKAKPSAIYVAVDGPRSGNSNDLQAYNEIIETLDSVSSGVPIHRLIRTTNLGCRDAVSSAISWFFDHEDQGIILEDDCVPHPSFFSWCSKLLHRFQDEPRIICISGHRGGPPASFSEFSFSFSRYPQIWGWATWKRVWDQYDPAISEWPSARLKDWATGYPQIGCLERRFWASRFDEVYHGVVDTWDYQFTYLALKVGGLTIIPRRNLVTNVGFDDRATHTKNPRSTIVAKHAYEADNPLQPPSVLNPDEVYDRWLLRVNYRVLVSTAFRPLKKLLVKLKKGFT